MPHPARHPRRGSAAAAAALALLLLPLGLAAAEPAAAAPERSRLAPAVTGAAAGIPTAADGTRFILEIPAAALTPVAHEALRATPSTPTPASAPTPAVAADPPPVAPIAAVAPAPAPAPAVAPAPSPAPGRAPAAEPAGPAKPPTPPIPTPAATPPAVMETEITADNMDADFSGRLATFEGNVVVSDPRMKLQADRLIARYSEKNELTRVEATGNVVIVQPDMDRRAMAARAEYDVVKGAIVLVGNPSLRTGMNELTGADKIIYLRDRGEVKTEGGRPRIVAVTEGAGKAPLPGFLQPQEPKAVENPPAP